MTTVREKFREAWDSEVAKRLEQSPSFKLEEFTATGRASAKYGGKRSAEWWADNGPQMVQDWIDWREQTGWQILDIAGHPCVEIELRFTLPGMDMQVLAYIDRVFVLPTGELTVTDLKTGRTPETAEQLGLYRVGLGLVHDIWPSWGHFWSPGGKGHSQPYDLTMYTPEYFSALFQQAVAGVNAGTFLPQPANSCRNWCGVARFCHAVGGAEAKGNDPLAG